MDIDALVAEKHGSFFLLDEGAILLVVSNSPNNPILCQTKITRDEIKYCKRKYSILETTHSSEDDIATLYYHFEAICSFSVASRLSAIQTLLLVLPEIFYLRDSELRAFLASKKMGLIEDVKGYGEYPIIFDLTGTFKILDSNLALTFNKSAFYITKKDLFMDFLYEYAKENEIPMIVITEKDSYYNVLFLIGTRCLKDELYDDTFVGITTLATTVSELINHVER